MMRASHILLVCASVAAFSGSILWPMDAFATLRVTQVRATNISYFALTPPPVRVAATDASQKSLLVAMRFRVLLIRGYQDVFETAPLNKGMRLEIAAPHTLALIVAAKNVRGFVPYVLSTKLEENQWHSLKIVCGFDRTLTIVFDGHDVAHVRDRSLEYVVSDVRFGEGYDATRRLHGQIEGGEITYRVAASGKSATPRSLGVTKTHVTNIAYSTVGSEPMVIATSNVSPKSLVVAMQFRPFGIQGYQDVFQTAPLNSGMRLEIGAPHTLALIVAAKNAEGFVPYILSTTLEENQWHSLEIVSGFDSRLTVRLDGQTVVDVVDPLLSYEVADLRLGEGFDETRFLRGQIKNGSVVYQVEVPNTMSALESLLVRTMFLIGGLACFFRFARTLRYPLVFGRFEL